MSTPASSGPRTRELPEGTLDAPGTRQAVTLTAGPIEGDAGSGALLGGIVLVALVLRFAFIGRNSLWFDEAWVAWMVHHRWPELVALLQTNDAHPPLYYLLMKAWTGVAGTSEAALRVPSACFSAASVYLSYRLMRRVSSESVSLLSASLVAVSPFSVMAGQDARMYALVGMLAAGSTLALVGSVERGGGWRWAGYVGLAALLVYTHYFGALVLIAHGVWVAGWERRHLGRWTIGMAAVAALYAPWVPTLWNQTVWVHRMYGAGRFRTHGAMLNLGAVLGLLAFGGSLLGMPGYLTGGSPEAAPHALLLLPFLIVLWRGILSLANRPRSLAVVGLPPAIAIGIMFLASLANVGVFPRWFSFLIPFYAMLLAQGIFDIAEHFRTRRGAVIALLTTGLVLYSGPVLARYYLDPGFRAYRWRAAADLVKAQARPGDAFLYVSGEPSIALWYYVREPHPSLILVPTEAFPELGRRAMFGSDQARQIAIRFSQAWLFVTVPVSPGDPFMQKRLFPELANAFRFTGPPHEFGGIWVYRLEAKSSR